MPTPEEIKKQVLETSAIVENTLKSVAAQIGDIFQDALSEADGITKIFGKDVQKQLNSLARSTDKMVENQIKIKLGQASSKDIAKQLLEYEVKREVLEKRISNLMAEQPELAAQLKSQLADVDAANADYVEGLKEQEKELIRIENRMGLMGKLVKGLNKIPIIGNLIEADKVETEMKKAAADGKSAFITGFKEVGKSIGKNITDPLTVITFLLKNAFAIDTQITNIGKELGVSRDIAKDIRGESEAYSRSVNDNFINTNRLVKAQAELSQQLGIAVKFSDEEAANFARLTELTGLSAEEAGKLSLFSASTGKSTKDYAASIRSGAFFAQQATKTHFSTKQILQDVSKLSAGILAKFQNNPDAIAKAVVQAKALGTTLEQTDKIAESLLNFETSIENELKAELITGRQLNFEKARAAALTGDQATLMQEVANQAGSLEEFQSMNVIAQKSLAEAFSMSSDEMAEMLMKQEAITKYGSEASKLNKEQLADFEKSGLSLDAFIEKQEQQRSAQEKFADLLTKVQQTIADIAAGPLGSLISGFASLLDNAFALYSIIGLIGTVSLVKMISGLTTALALKKLSTRESIKSASAEAAGAAANAAGSAAKIPGGGWLIAGGVAATLFGALIGYLAGAKKGDDVISPGYGKRMMFGPEGAVSFNDKDTIVAGTDLNKGGIQNSSVVGGGIDISPLVSAINEVRNAVNALANKPTPAMAIQVGAEKLGEVVGKQAETGTNQYKNAYRLA